MHFLAFNWERPLFADVRMRRAVQYALDRRALADAGESVGIPASRLLARGVPGYEKHPLYPSRADLGRARKLAGNRTGRAVVFTWDDPPYTDAFNRALRDQLASIGIRMVVIPMVQGESEERWLAKARRADLIWGGLSASTPDPAAYLEPLFLPAHDATALHRLARLSSPARERAAASLARTVERKSLFAVYVTDAMPELVSRRLGCIVHNPVYAGVDLAALCLRR